MCYGCWEEAGKPQIDNARVRAAVPLIQAVYDHSCTGGNLHIVLDDWNITDKHVAWCSLLIDGAGVLPDDGNLADCHKAYNDRKRRELDPPEQLAAERACCDAFLLMTEAERMSALARYDGFQ